MTYRLRNIKEFFFEAHFICATTTKAMIAMTSPANRAENEGDVGREIWYHPIIDLINEAHHNVHGISGWFLRQQRKTFLSAVDGNCRMMNRWLAFVRILENFITFSDPSGAIIVDNKTLMEASFFTTDKRWKGFRIKRKWVLREMNFTLLSWSILRHPENAF